MSESLVKRQHFVPRTYLKHFGVLDGSEYLIYVLSKSETDENCIFQSKINNVALENHLYTLPGETVAQKMAIEKFYSNELEQHYDSIYKILTDPTKTEVTNEQRELIISTVVTSDNPVIAENNSPQRFAPFDPTNVLKLPLDSKHILMLMPENTKGLENVVFRQNVKKPFSEIQKLTSNYSQMQNSERFMFGSKGALESYLLTKQESERPLKKGEKMADVFAKLKELGL
jgi:hypothetical protein